MAIEDPRDVERLVERSTELADQMGSYQEEMAVGPKVKALEKKATANASAIVKGRRARRWVTAMVMVCLLASGAVTYNTVQLRQLVHTECVRSVKGAELRNKLIEDLTKHVATPAHGSPSQLVKTVADRNAQLDTERSDLVAIGDKIPNVKC